MNGEEKIFEIKIASIANMPEEARNEIIKKVSQKDISFQRNFKGFAKITYINKSPKRVYSIEPIEYTIIEYFKASHKEGVNIPVF